MAARARDAYAVNESWARQVAEAIATRHGVLLTNAIDAAEHGDALRLHADDAAAVAAAVHALYRAVHRAVRRRTPRRNRDKTGGAAAARRRPARGNKDNDNDDDADDDEDDDDEDARERRLCVTVAVRVAVTGALALCQQARDKASAHDGDKHEQQEQQQQQQEEAEQQCAYHTTLLKGLLHAFDAFQQVHSMSRAHYPPRAHGGHAGGAAATTTTTTTVGTVGWDTLLLLHFVHRIPHVALRASSVVVDEATGHVVRSWRRLLVALQTIDARDAAEHSRRRGALALVNGLLQLLFARYNTHQCAALLQAVEHAEASALATRDSDKSILQPSQHMTSEVVTYHYYRGRMQLYERRIADAYESLRHAYTLLPPAGQASNTAQQRNKQRVRFFLAVAGLACGRRIPDSIARTDELLSLIFAPVERAIERGDVLALYKALDTFGATLRRRGVYLLLLHELTAQCHLRLLARVHAAIQHLDGVDASRIRMDTIVAAYRAVLHEGKQLDTAAASTTDHNNGNNNSVTQHTAKAEPRKRARDAASEHDACESMTNDRIMLWLAHLIARGHVRGYLSHEHKTLVLSKVNPFPQLQTDATTTTAA